MLGFSPLSPSLVEGFALGRLQVAFIVPSIYLGGLFFSLPAGRLADRIGVRPTFLGGLTLGALGLVAAAGSPVFTVFLLCLFVAGIGWSVVDPALGKAIVDLRLALSGRAGGSHRSVAADEGGGGAVVGQGGVRGALKLADDAHRQRLAHLDPPLTRLA